MSCREAHAMLCFSSFLNRPQGKTYQSIYITGGLAAGSFALQELAKLQDSGILQVELITTLTKPYYNRIYAEALLHQRLRPQKRRAQALLASCSQKLLKQQQSPPVQSNLLLQMMQLPVMVILDQHLTSVLYHTFAV